MFRARTFRYPLHELRGLHEITGFARHLHLNGPWRRAELRLRSRRRRTPSVPLLLIAGLAVFAFVKLMSLTKARKRWGIQRVVLTALLLGVGAVVLVLRRSARRYRW